MRDPVTGCSYSQAQWQEACTASGRGLEGLRVQVSVCQRAAPRLEGLCGERRPFALPALGAVYEPGPEWLPFKDSNSEKLKILELKVLFGMDFFCILK